MNDKIFGLIILIIGIGFFAYTAYLEIFTFCPYLCQVQMVVMVILGIIFVVIGSAILFDKEPGT